MPKALADVREAKTQRKSRKVREAARNAPKRPSAYPIKSEWEKSVVSFGRVQAQREKSRLHVLHVLSYGVLAILVIVLFYAIARDDRALLSGVWDCVKTAPTVLITWAIAERAYKPRAPD